MYIPQLITKENNKLKPWQQVTREEVLRWYRELEEKMMKVHISRSNQYL